VDRSQPQILRTPENLWEPGLPAMRPPQTTKNSYPATPDARFKTPLVSHHALIVAETNIL
jgi:hypothetical protein